MRAGGMDRRTIWQASRRPITWRGRGGDSKAPLEPSRAATAQANARGERDWARKCARGAAEEVRDRPSSVWSAGVPKLPACERASADCLPRLVGGSSSRPSRRRFPKEDGESPKKKRRTLAIARARPTVISVVHRMRFVVPSMAKTTHRPPARSSAPPSARPPARGILRRTRLERQQGGLDRASTPTARSSRAVVAACPLAVSEGRPLGTGRGRPSL
jgi:hypothetical protein